MRQMSTRNTLAPSIIVDKECVVKLSESSDDLSDDSSLDEEIKENNN